jgi:hypothetical protein
MRRIDLNDTPFDGVSRSVAHYRSPRSRVACRHCGSTLTGSRLERRRWSTVAGVTYELDVYRCGCGAGRHVRREVAV